MGRWVDGRRRQELCPLTVHQHQVLLPKTHFACLETCLKPGPRHESAVTAHTDNWLSSRLTASSEPPPVPARHWRQAGGPWSPVSITGRPPDRRGRSRGMSSTSVDASESRLGQRGGPADGGGFRT